MKVFGSSGTRGIANEELTPAFVQNVTKAVGTVWQTDRVAVARDTRKTGRMLVNAAVSGLQSVGISVDRLGVLPTPGTQAYAEREGIPAVMVTASHNPAEYNGVKLIGADGVELPVDVLERVEEKFLTKQFETVPWSDVGTDESVSTARRSYVEDLLNVVDQDAISDASLTVALDPGHGAGALTSPEFFRRLGCDVVTVNSQPDGNFPGRDPEPVEENLHDLGNLVRSTDADVGIAHDGDADRAIFFDERGEYIEGDATLAALAEDELQTGDITVSAVNVSQRLVDVCERTGADLELTPIGSTRIMTRIQELEAIGESVPVAGEGNGGIIFPNYRLTRDGAYTGARFLELLAERPASEVIEPYDDYFNVRINIGYEDDVERDAILSTVAERSREEDAELTTTDGYRLDYGDAWVLARPSGTEPVVRIYAEATRQERADELAGELANALREAKNSIET